MTERIIVFIPAFNCANQITRVLTKLAPHQSLFEQIILVDNRSTDETITIASKAARELKFSNLRILLNDENYSLGGSHKVAFQYALEKGFDYLIVYHGDDQANINDLIPHLRNGAHRKYDCFLGSRFHQESRLEGYSAFRTYGNIILNQVCNLTCRARISDQGSGLNMYQVSFFKDKRIFNFPNNLTFNVYLLYHAYFSGKRCAFFPISWREEDQISNARVFQQAWQIIKLSLSTMFVRDNLYARPIPDKQYTSQVTFEQ
jgi:dolichol-phosphate mannosyltransferase